MTSPAWVGGSNWCSSSRAWKRKPQRREYGSPSGSRALLRAALVRRGGLGEQPPFFEYAQIDPHKVVTSEKCGECHIHEADVWKKTPHANGFKTLHASRRPRRSPRRWDSG